MKAPGPSLKSRKEGPQPGPVFSLSPPARFLQSILLGIKIIGLFWRLAGMSCQIKLAGQRSAYFSQISFFKTWSRRTKLGLLLAWVTGHRLALLFLRFLSDFSIRVGQPCLAALPWYPYRVRLFILAIVFLSLLAPYFTGPGEAAPFTWGLSGYAKSLSFFTKTTGMTPELVDNPLSLRESNESLFSTLERLRLKLRASYGDPKSRHVSLKMDYDQQVTFGSFVGTGDFRIAQKQMEERQFLDLSQTLVEDEDAFYLHRFYRLSLTYHGERFDLEVGRQQIPWGVGRFFTPTDLFNPFNPTQIELDERDGVDAAYLTTKPLHDYQLELVYTPEGGKLHPQRYLGRISRDFRGYEIGLLGGRVHRDHVAGFDLAGNLKDSAVRAEFLFRESATENDFIKFTVNADYNFPYNIYGLLEYHFNGQGVQNPKFYDWNRLIRGDVQQLAKNYLALLLGHDITPLIRIENRTIYNLNDSSFFIRPEIQYEIKPNFLITAGAQLFAGSDSDELGAPPNLYFGEFKYSF